MMRKVFIWGFILSVAAIIYFKFIAGTGIAFDKSRWSSQISKRFEMADDIIDSEMLIGKDTNQVKEMLGEPAWRISFSNQWNYHMGWEVAGLGALVHNLFLTFEDGKVKKVVDAKERD
ncbi:MAG: hypothetical protein QM737_19660 [Ferruginibacter sp.]